MAPSSFKSTRCILLQFLTIRLTLVECDINFNGIQAANLNETNQWKQGVPGDGYFCMEPNASLIMSPTAKISISSFSAMWVNENSRLFMDHDSSITIGSSSAMHIYGRMSLGKRSTISTSRYAHFDTDINRAVSLGDDSEIQLINGATVFLWDDFVLGTNSSVRLEKSGHFQLGQPRLWYLDKKPIDKNWLGYRPAVCILGNKSRLTLGWSSAFYLDGTLILPNAANITLGSFTYFGINSNTTLASTMENPTIYIGQQSEIIVREGTHCLLLKELIIAERVVFNLNPEIDDNRVKCFDSFDAMQKLMGIASSKVK